MAQLVVRNIEDAVVTRLRQRAARRGVSVEEEHRRILRAALLRSAARGPGTLKDHLLAMPDVGDDALFARPRAKLRPVKL
jgi:plasmid stability protein